MGAFSVTKEAPKKYADKFKQTVVETMRKEELSYRETDMADDFAAPIYMDFSKVLQTLRGFSYRR
jgi:hypothetical protein